eukprot:1152273-Pelagomonas_calceolata.AAC.7
MSSTQVCVCAVCYKGILSLVQYKKAATCNPVFWLIGRWHHSALTTPVDFGVKAAWDGQLSSTESSMDTTEKGGKRRRKGRNG